MIVMPANYSGGAVHYLAGRYPGSLGWLLTPGEFKEPREWLPYAVDNGAFILGADWKEEPFFELLDRCQLSSYKPRWVLVPDRVGDREQTHYLWRQYARRVAQYGWPLAFAVQDGMTIRDVPPEAAVVFVGGSTKWKWRSVAGFCAQFPRVHVGRVNWVDKLEFCEEIGVESVDGTGFFRGGERSVQGIQLAEFIAGRRRKKEQGQLIVP